MNREFLVSCIFFLYSIFTSYAQNPVAKIDLNMFGRPESEVHEPGFIPWFVNTANSITNTIEGVTITFDRAGSNGTALKSDWYKAGLQAPHYARLVNDGIIVDNGNTGAAIRMTLIGLPAGNHTLLVYHNNFANPDNNSFAPIDIYLNGTLTINGLIPTTRSESNFEATTSYLNLISTGSGEIVVLFQARTSSNATNKNVAIAGFEINTPDAAKQAKTPIPDNKDQHVNTDNGSFILQWQPGANAVTHHIYFGTDEAQVANATPTSGEYKGSQTSLSFTVSGLYSRQIYYWRVDQVTANGIITKGDAWSFRPRQLAFPDAEGYGKYAMGGRGGKVVYVTNLNDDGPGSLREAITNDIGPRTILFNVSGLIHLQSRLTINQSYVTIAGQTAPGKGICVRGAPLGMSGVTDVIVRHMRLRLGSGHTFDGMGMQGSEHSIMDHCSISWTIDEAFSSRNAKNITLQRTLIAEALNVANHQNYPAGTGHGFAASIGGDVGSFHHNLLAHCHGRNWSLAGGLDARGFYAGKLDIFNNVVYNWGTRGTDGGAHQVNFVNNYYKKGAATTQNTILRVQLEGLGQGSQSYFYSGNIVENTNGSLACDGSNNTCSQSVTVAPTQVVDWDVFVNQPFFSSEATIHSARNAYKSVLSDVGATQPAFDNHDNRIVDETLNGTFTYTGSQSNRGGIIDHENDAGGYESYPFQTRANNWDTDKDGLPDWWERYYGLNLTSATDDFSDANLDDNADGYTHLDEYLDWMANIHFFISHNEEVSINLQNIFAGYTSGASYSVSNIINGNVTINAGIAIFTPISCGFASFNLRVIDSQGSSMTRKIGVFTESSTPGNCTINEPDPAVITKHGSGSSSQTINIGESIQGFHFAWQNATTVTVTGMPTGINATIDNVNRTISFSGTPTESGVFTYTITTQGGNPNTERSGTFTVIDPFQRDCNNDIDGTAYLDNCGICVGGNTGFAPCVGTMELEDACDVEGVMLESINSGFSGAGYVNTTNIIGAYVSWYMNSDAEQEATFTFRYANGGNDARNGNIIINGTTAGQLINPSTGAWTNWELFTTVLPFTQGLNEIVLEATSDGGLANLDLIHFSTEVNTTSCTITSFDETQKTELILYPNPTNSSVHFSKKVEWELFNVVGIKLNSGESNEIDLERYSKGSYFIKTNEQVFKIIKL